MGNHTQRAPTSTSFGTRWPLRWRATRDSSPPIQEPPMNTAGGGEVRWTAGGEGSGGLGRAAISSSSSSMTVGLTPIVARSFFMAWHMQQAERLKMMTGCSDMSRWILSSAVSAPSMERDVAEEVAPGLSSRWASSGEQRHWKPCIAGGEDTEMDVQTGGKWMVEWSGEGYAWSHINR